MILWRALSTGTLSKCAHLPTSRVYAWMNRSILMWVNDWTNKYLLWTRYSKDVQWNCSVWFLWWVDSFSMSGCTYWESLREYLQRRYEAIVTKYKQQSVATFPTCSISVLHVVALEYGYNVEWKDWRCSGGTCYGGHFWFLFSSSGATQQRRYFYLLPYSPLFSFNTYLGR